MQADTLITGATVITMDAQRRVIRDGAVAFAGDTIVAVGKSADLAGIDAREVIDGSGFVLTPGFINCHVHVTETLIRGFIPEDLPFEENLGKWVIPLYKSHDAAEQAVSAKMAVAAMLRSGTTTFIEAGTVIAFDEVMAAIEGTGIRARMGRWAEDRAWDPSADQQAMTAEAFDALAADVAAYPQDGRRIAAWPNLIGHMTSTDALWQQVTDLAKQTGTKVSAHMSPAIDDSQWYLANTGRRPVEHLADLGVLGPHLNLVHMVHIDQAEADLVAQSGTNVTQCPGASIQGGYGLTQHGLFPELAAAGVNIALGTDGADNHDMMRAMPLMAALFKDARQDRALFPAHEVLEMATLNGAKVLGMADSLGSIAVGMKADLVAHDTRRPEWQPINNPVDQLVWSANGSGVHSVWVDGVRVVEAFRCTTIDEDALYAQGQAMADAVLGRSGLPLLSEWPIN
ncbi:S-adenosylhomocysteine deaminase [Novosphingobium sp. Rr 2-17]|uniref:amidohydrolase family protein n=1 Tax=Novosphingobium sp. Rr 2-17 TaxID=555793 RepID=UPI00026994C5|nr:amidohydrolase family protein [Novosphingobium sp. Rr 2-17]EIZ81021.1 S-adenosylhomocysteine deaminase [Novosphingobium sp. Rr 2-17]